MAVELASEDEENIRQKRGLKAKRMAVMTVTCLFFLDILGFTMMPIDSRLRRFSMIAPRLEGVQNE